MNTETARKLAADVLVIGGGLAGMMAALSAREHGADVLLVNAGVLGEAGDSAIASGGFAVAANHATGDSVDAHLEDTLNSGKGLSAPSVLTAVTHGAPEMLRRLRSYGVEFAIDGGGELSFAPIPGHRFPRSVRCRGGGTAALMQPLSAAVVDSGVRVLDNTFVRALVRGAGRVRGAALTDLHSGTQARVCAGSIVLATGGLGRLFAHTSNNDDVFGSGYALALEAGCSVVDIEFVQFTPTALVAPVFAAGMSPGGALMAQPGVVLRNARGERFMQRYDPENAECTTRDVLARAIHQEISEGRGSQHGGVFLDLSGTTREQIADISGRFLRAMDAGDFDPFGDMVEVAPEAHFCMGGVAVDANGRTEVAGLFAAGEVTTGLHGANRLNSNALTEAAVTGETAGRAAAAEARRIRPPNSGTAWPPKWQLNSQQEANLLGGAEALITELRRTVQQCGGVVRTEALLLEGLRRLDEIVRSSAATRTTIQQDPEQVVLRQMCLVARAVLTAALQRTESRGSHFRSDHPETLAAQTVHYRLHLRPDGELVVSEAPAGAIPSLVGRALDDVRQRS